MGLQIVNFSDEHIAEVAAIESVSFRSAWSEESFHECRIARMQKALGAAYVDLVSIDECFWRKNKSQMEGGVHLVLRKNVVHGLTNIP